MKKVKHVLFAVLLLAGTVPAMAQVDFSLGIKGGLNFAKIDASDPGTTYDNRTGYHFGAFGLFKFSKIGIQPEILFSQQGSKVKVNTGDFDANFSYINIPIIVKLYTVAGLNLQAGPQFGFLSKAEVEDTDVKNGLKNSDISLALGVGWDLPFGLSIDARYNLGLSDINDDYSSDQVKNQVWQISAGFKLFRFGK